MIESQIVARVLPSKCREAVKVLLQEVYGYEDFRNLEVYDDLFRGKEKLQLSQGQLIEEVIMEAEKGIKGDSSAHNLLLTAPTGAGKSLLFQLPAIYLGNEYKLLTLVVSPLKALIVDQVEALRELGYERVAYASSDLSPEQKNEVYRRVREGEVDLFYLSPELLLAYDISYFVGERRIGLVVVDEAHTVTTWGKEFRVDYWFLGRHLEALKNALGYVFPVFALTATAVWNPEGGNDMIFDTIRSLHLAPCALYVGTVKRENIGFDITAMTIEEGETYDKAKQRTVAARVEDFLDGHKTIIYYPFAGGIDMKLKTWVYPANWHWVASYYGKKDKEQKAEIIQAFKEGEKKIIVATKAFGMGVDISDIDRVYHVAPSSTFVDYIQEIGRAARDKNITGVAVTDFNERDFYYMKRLHSAGAISQEQLGMILKKVWEIYLMKGCSDEMQMSLSDFEFAVKLPRKKNKLEYESDLEQVVKTALLWIEEDLSFRHGGSPVEINSQTLFSDGYVQEKTGDAAFRKKYKQVRLTKDGKQFEILKFRSMRVDAEKDGVARLSTGDKDDRITKVGHIIRACRLDELPQLLNILKGDLSVVGPRPERPEIAAQYCEEMPEFALRLQAKAGLTGYAQVYGKYNTTPYDKLQMDLMYIAHPSLIEDLKIMLATVKILFMPESTEGVSEGQTTAMSGENR